MKYSFEPELKTNKKPNPDFVPPDIKLKHTCSLCDDHYGCDNCYYGQIESKVLNPNCYDCEVINHIIPTEWQPLGDTYCRKCGRKLKEG